MPTYTARPHRSILLGILLLVFVPLMTPVGAAGLQRQPAALASNPPTWRLITHIPDGWKRWMPAAAFGLDGRLYIFGGAEPGCCILGTAEVYTPRTHTWAHIADMPTARDDAVAITAPNGFIYVIGGENGSGLNVVEAYDPQTNTWRSRAPLTIGRSFLGATLGLDGRIYVFGGTNDSRFWTSMKAYTPAINRWTTLRSLPQPVAGGAGGTGLDGQIYAIGGNAWQGTNTLQVYLPTSNTWRVLADLPLMYMFQGTVGADGRVYALSSNVPRAVAYDPATNRWVWVARPMQRHFGGQAMVGPDGRIYAVSGEDPQGGARLVEAYGPAIALSTTSGPPGATVVLTGTNFAAGATTTLYWGTAITGTALVTATAPTDGAGDLAAPLTFTVPSGVAAGVYPVTARDNRSRYPVHWMFTVP